MQVKSSAYKINNNNRENKELKETIICISGPTASGKTALSIELAHRLNGEIVSCDSMQIYRGMDIGTAKPTAEERALAVHHMIDICSPNDNYSCADYVRDASQAVSDIIKRGKMPIICGGTGLYLESLIYESTLSVNTTDDSVKASLMLRSPEENYRMLCEVDPESAASIHPNNVKRVIRALEIYIVSGRTKSSLDSEYGREKKYNSHVYVLGFADRARLYERIDKRVDIMISLGLVDEVKSLGLSRDTTAGQAIGYKEIMDYLDGDASLDEAIYLIKKGSRNYAKRQITWWGRNNDVGYIDMTDLSVSSATERIIGSL